MLLCLGSVLEEEAAAQTEQRPSTLEQMAVNLEQDAKWRATLKRDVRALLRHQYLDELIDEHPDRVRGYVAVNPNYTEHALAEIRRCLDGGMIGIKLAASRRADDPLLDPICALAAERGVPVLHHTWQSRRRDYQGQEASDAVAMTSYGVSGNSGKAGSRNCPPAARASTSAHSTRTSLVRWSYRLSGKMTRS